MDFNTPEVSLTALKAKYGDMFTVNFGQQDVVVINDGKLLREVFCSPLCGAKYEKFNDTIFAETGGPCGEWIIPFPSSMVIQQDPWHPTQQI